MESSQTSLINKYKVAGKGLSSFKSRSKPVIDKKFNKSVEMSGSRTSKYSTKQHTKIRPIIRRNNEIQMNRTSYINNTTWGSKSKLKPNNKTQTAQINLLTDPLIQWRIKDGKDIQKSIKTKSQLSNSGVRKKVPSTASNYACRRRKKEDADANNFSKAMMMNYATQPKKNVEIGINSNVQSKDSSSNRHRVHINRSSYVKPTIDKTPIDRKLIKYRQSVKPTLYNEYFVRKRSMSSITNKNKNTLRRKAKLGGSSSYDTFKPNLSIIVPADDCKEGEIKLDNIFQSTSLKSISISLLASSKTHSASKKRNAVLKKYMNNIQSLKSNRVLPKYERPKLKYDNSNRSLGRLEKVKTTKVFQEWKPFLTNKKVISIKPPEDKKLKSTSQQRLNNSIFTSLTEIKKNIRKRAKLENKAKSKSPKRIKSNSLHTITIELPMWDSNKTKATFTESPPQSFPLNAEIVLGIYSSRLSELEKVELRDYKKTSKSWVNNKFQVYFLGDISTREHAPVDERFDDENGDYIAVKGTNIYFRYEVKDYIGKGSFGKVYIVYDHKEKRQIALKILRSFPKEAYQIDLEPEILMYLKKNCSDQGTKLTKYHIIDVIEYFEYRLHKCISMPIYEANLYEKIRELNHQGFTIDIIRRIAIQMLRCLKYLKENKVIHCDLKPENILLKNKQKSGVVIIDFGSSWMENQKMYAYIQSRFYRAPEVLLGIPYSYPIDMWSLGCILVEMYIGVPLFDGTNEKEQIWLIMELRGIPPINIIENASRKTEFFDENLMPVLVKDDKDQPIRPNSSSLAHFIENEDKTFMKFIDSWLHWDSDLRITPEEALRHDWILEGLTEDLQKSLQN
jgi:dual specificity tyrosine-phosphorylation-regulated kinase 2/3/4